MVATETKREAIQWWSVCLALERLDLTIQNWGWDWDFVFELYLLAREGNK